MRELQGQYWERLGQVVFLPLGLDPNEDLHFTGWRKFTREQAREVRRARSTGGYSSAMDELEPLLHPLHPPPPPPSGWGRFKAWLCRLLCGETQPNHPR